LPGGNSGALFAPIHVDGGYDTLQYTIAQGSEFKVGGVSYVESGNPRTSTLNVVFGVTDNDGDIPSGGNFDITITAGDGGPDVNTAMQILLQQQQTT
jgi:hypothetical protein